MTAATTAVSTQREPELLGQTVVVIGGSAGIVLETARRARAEGASVILTGFRRRRATGLQKTSNTDEFQPSRRSYASDGYV
jgi:NAD(P)-dependent dehydrogenase (short-subunit alcohol dehydrogenase family)